MMMMAMIMSVWKLVVVVTTDDLVTAEQETLCTIPPFSSLSLSSSYHHNHHCQQKSPLQIYEGLMFDFCPWSRATKFKVWMLLQGSSRTKVTPVTHQNHLSHIIGLLMKTIWQKLTTSQLRATFFTWQCAIWYCHFFGNIVPDNFFVSDIFLGNIEYLVGGNSENFLTFVSKHGLKRIDSDSRHFWAFLMRQRIFSEPWIISINLSTILICQKITLPRYHRST